VLQHLYQQVADDLRAKINDGTYPAGTKLPAKPELSKHYDVALGTLDKAIEVLRKAGLVETRQGSGMYVRQPPPEERTDYETVRDQVATLQQDVAALSRKVAELDGRVDEVWKAETRRALKDEELSLVPLAGRVGISKARADQIIRAERQKETDNA